MSLLPDLPLELRSARIGCCFDSMTRKLFPDRPTFDLAKLNKAHGLKFTGGPANMKTHANASSTDFAESSFLSSDAKVQAQAWGVQGSAGFKMSNATKSTSSSYEMNCYIHYIFSGQVIRLQKLGATVFLECMMPHFQEAYKAVMAAKDTPEYLAQYKKFVEQFGDGCVTTLHLASGSACKISVKHSNKTEAITEKYGASVALNNPAVVGVAAASEWGGEMAKAHSEAEMEVVFQTLPQDSPTMDWAQKIADKYQGKPISLLSDLAQTPTQPATSYPTAPPFPKMDPLEKSKKALPSPELKVTAREDVEESLTREMMTVDGFDGNEEDYKRKQDGMINDVTAQHVVEEARRLSDKANSVG